MEALAELTASPTRVAGTPKLTADLQSLTQQLVFEARMHSALGGAAFISLHSAFHGWCDFVQSVGAIASLTTATLRRRCDELEQALAMAADALELEREHAAAVWPAAAAVWRQSTTCHGESLSPAKQSQAHRSLQRYWRVHSDSTPGRLAPGTPRRPPPIQRSEG